MSSKLDLNTLPRDLQLLVASFLPPLDLRQAATVSKVIQKVFADPRLWQQVAAKLNIKITRPENPQEDVFDYYKKTNEAALRYLRPKNIRRSSDVYEQNQIIELYIAENKGTLKDKLLVAVRAGDVGLVRMLLQANVSIDDDCLLEATLAGSKELVDLLLKANARKNPGAIQIAVRDGHKDILIMLIKAGFKPTKENLELAQQKGAPEIVELLRAAMSPPQA